MEALWSAQRAVVKAFAMAAVAACSVFEYYWHGARLPAWDLKFQVQRDIAHHVLSGCLPLIEDGRDIDKVDVFEVVARIRAVIPKEVPIPASEGVGGDIVIPVHQVPVDPAVFKGIGVAEDGLCALCERDQQDTERRLVCELITALPTAAVLRAQTADSEVLVECRPLHSRETVVLYLHGGGYIVGNACMSRLLTRWISDEAGVRVLVANYRLAPEHPFPAAILDAFIVYKFLLQQGFDANRIVVAGDSAGGHLALALAHLLRFTQVAQPAALVLLSPLTDMSRNKPSVLQNKRYDVLIMNPIESPLSLARLFYAPGHPLTAQMRNDLADMLLTPLNGDFTGFPPTLIQGGAKELLIDDITELHAAICAQNPEHTDLAVLESYADMIHAFQALSHRPEAVQAMVSIGRFIRRMADHDG